MDDVTLSTQSGYPRDRAKAALSVLLEVAHVLAEYRDEIVVVGGWVPALLIPDGLVTHTGSLDVDLAVDHRVLAHREHYATMLALLERSGYVQEGLALLRDAFASPRHTGPRGAALFEEPADDEALEIAARDAYERMTALLLAIGDQGPRA